MINLVNYMSLISIPLIIFIIISYSILEKINVFDVFLDGAKEGMKIVINIFPTLIGLFLAIELLNNSGILDFFIKVLSPVLSMFKIPTEIMPLAILRPISGSGSLAIATELLKRFGVDSKIGLIIATIMGSTETTLYTIAVYTSSVNIKKIRFVLIASLAADLTGMIVSVVFWNIMS